MQLFQSGLPSLGLFSGEGGQFLGSFAMSSDHWLKTVTALSALWDGEDIRRVRKGDGAATSPGRRLALHLLLQPTIAPHLLGNAEIAGQGFLSRILPAAPTALAGTRMGRIALPTDPQTIAQFGTRILTILETEPSKRADGGLKPRTLALSSDAEAQWWAFSDAVEAQLGVGSALHPIKAFGSKMAEHAARLGAVLQLVEDLDAQMLDAAHLGRGIELVEFYANEWLRLHEAQAINADLVLAEHLRLWLKDEWSENEIGLPEVYQCGPGRLRDAATARATMRLLEDHGWVVSLPDGAKVRGVLRREAWEIVR